MKLDVARTDRLGVFPFDDLPRRELSRLEVPEDRVLGFCLARRKSEGCGQEREEER